MRMSLDLWAAIPPLEPEAKLIGSGLGLLLLGMSVALAIHLRRGTESSWRPSGSRGARTVTAVLLAVCGVLLLAGSWTDPQAAPRRFVWLWCGVILTVLLLLPAAFVDLMQVRYAELVARGRLLRQHKSELERDLRDWHRRRSGSSGRSDTPGAD